MNKQSASASASGGIGFFGLLGIVFIALKLLGVINWAWIWVLSPIWGSCLLSLLIVAGVLVVWVGLAVLAKALDA